MSKYCGYTKTQYENMLACKTKIQYEIQQIMDSIEDSMDLDDRLDALLQQNDAITERLFHRMFVYNDDGEYIYEDQEDQEDQEEKEADEPVEECGIEIA